MKEIGGYLELDRYSGGMLHEEGLKLNYARFALYHVIKTNSIKKLFVPKFM